MSNAGQVGFLQCVRVCVSVGILMSDAVLIIRLTNNT